MLVALAAPIGVMIWKAESERSAASNPAPSEKSIAVLPFGNLSKDQENAFFADGVQDEILTDLAKIADLKVISRTSRDALQKRDRTQSARDRAAIRGGACGGRKCSARRQSRAGQRAVDRCAH